LCNKLEINVWYGKPSASARFWIASFDVQPRTVVTVTPTIDTGSSFLSLYDTAFNLASLNVNYLGDQGQACWPPAMTLATRESCMVTSATRRLVTMKEHSHVNT
jgi:hypothetical protein